MDVIVGLDSFGFGLLKRPGAASFLLPKRLESEGLEGCAKMLVLVCGNVGRFFDSVA